MDFFETVRNRRSVRSYRSDPVEPEKIGRILEAARLAPTAVNYQAFKIFVIKTEGRKEELKKVYRKEWFSEAPYILGVCSIPKKCWVRRDQKSYADVDAAIVMDHIILAATTLGLGTCWIGAFDAESAKSMLNLDETMEPVAFTPLGYPREETPAVGRKPLEDLVVYL